VFGHHVYAGVSVAVATAALLPGWTGQAVTERAFGDDRTEIDLFPLDHPSLPTGLRRLAARLAALARFVGVVRRYRAAARDFAATAVAEHEPDVTALSDAALVARALLLRDRLSQGWVHSQVGDLFAHVTAGPLRRRAKNGPAALNRGGDVTSEHAFVAVGALAELLAADDELRALAGWGDLDAVRTHHPEFAAAFDEILTRLGHRGPGEAELSNETFAKRAAQLLAAAVNTAEKPEPVSSEPDEEPVLTDETETAAEETPEPEKPAEDAPVKVKRGVADRLAIAGQRARELSRDATMRYTDELRRLVREWGRRQLDAGRLAAVDDVYFLTLDELLALPADAPDRIARRRAEHDRVRDIRMPAVVNGSWRPEATHELLPSGKQLTGVGVAEGVVEGRVRVVSAQAEAVLEPGEILVTHVADVGHTALFGYAAAVVTDLGEPMSRAAILARERGIPCVANTRDASVRLGDGAFVRVDGVAGTVAVLEPAPVMTPS
jgi:phosphohistidine swiveling domain-containing protein